MGILEKTYGSIKDSTSIGLAKINSNYAKLDIAIIKATNHLETPPKERYVRKIFSATSAVQPRADVAYCIHALARRLAKTRSWIVALKALVVIHRTLREGDPSFREELLKHSLKLHFLHISNFKDNSSPLAWDYSAWVRAYALFLEERLQCYKTLRYDVDTEPLTKAESGTAKTSRTRYITSEALLAQLPALQQLMFRLIGCKPEGVARNSYLIQYALLLVLKESFKIYCAINDGLNNLEGKFFDMSRHDAATSLSIYRRAGQQADELENFYDFCKGLELARLYQFPLLKQPSPSFLTTMEEHLRDLRDTPQKMSNRIMIKDAEEQLPVVMQEDPKSKTEDITPLISLDDDTISLSKDAELEESSELELAIVPSSDLYPAESNSSETAEHISTGWELALVTASNDNKSLSTENKMAGGFDKLLLDSLYEDENARRRIQLHKAGYSLNTMQQNTNPFDQQTLYPTATGMEMVLMHPNPQQYQPMQPPYQIHQPQLVQHSSMVYTGPYTQYYTQHMQQNWTSSNPFADPVPSFTQNRPLFY